jgi:hypothetical protein
MVPTVRNMLVVIAALLVGGCASLASVSSGHVGCAPDDIIISDEASGWNTTSWVATCNGKNYFCSSVGGSGRYGGGPEVSCTEESSSQGRSAER